MSAFVRLQEIADRAGVSRATVSLALRNHSKIAPQTRERIRKLAEDLGYRPNPLIAALMTQQRAARQSRPTHLTLAMIMCFSRREASWPFLSESLLRRAAERATELGYRLEEFWLGDLKMTDQRLSAVLLQRNVPGVLIAPLPPSHGQLDMSWPQFAAVAIGYSLRQPPLHKVTTDRFHAMRLAVQELRRRGYGRIGLAIRDHQDVRVDQQWSAAFLLEQQRVPASRRTPLFLAAQEEWDEPTFAKWFQAARPDAILGYDPVIITWLRKMRKRVPQDVGFAHLWVPDPSGTFAGLYHNPPAIGAASVDFLVGMIQRNERGLPAGPQTLLLQASWQDGATLRRPQRHR